MRKIVLLFALITAYGTSFAQTKDCPFPEDVIDRGLGKQVYEAIKAVGLEDNIYCSQHGNKLYGYKQDSDDPDANALQVGIYYTIESIENSTYKLRKEYCKNIKKIYDLVKGKDKVKPEITFRLYFISKKGTYPMGKVAFNKEGKPWPYVNEKYRYTYTDYTGNIFPGISSPQKFGYTADIMW
jgi:hypothetical protein